MSSTSVHSKNNMHIVGGQTVVNGAEQNINMPPKGSGIGPSIIEVVEGEKAVIPVQSNIVVKDENRVVARAEYDSEHVKDVKNIQEKDIKSLLSGKSSAINQAIRENANNKTNKKEDMSK